jgi:hypothetical protein
VKKKAKDLQHSKLRELTEGSNKSPPKMIGQKGERKKLIGQQTKERIKKSLKQHGHLEKIY